MLTSGLIWLRFNDWLFEARMDGCITPGLKLGMVLIACFLQHNSRLS